MTALQDCERRYRTLLDSIDQGYCVLEVLFDPTGAAADYRFLEVNRAFPDLTGLRDAVGRRMREMHPRHEDRWFDTFGRVARTGRPERFEIQAGHTGDRWFDLYAFPAGPPETGRVGALFADVTERKRAVEAGRAAEHHKAFLLALSDAIRPLNDPAAVQEAANRTLGQRLGTDRAYYCEVNEATGVIRIARDYVRAGVSSLVGDYSLAAFGWVGPSFRAGRPMVVADVATTPLLGPADRPPLAALSVGSFVAVPLVKGGGLAALLCVTDVAPRAWTADEVELVAWTAERTWAAVERTRTDAVIRASESRFRTLVESLPDAVFINVGGRVAYCNPSCVSLFGATDPGQLVGRTPFELYSPAYHDLIRGRIATIRATGKPVPPIEEEVMRLDGLTAPVLVTALPIADGGSDATLVVLHDLTERKRIERRLRDQEELLREAAELAHVGGWSFDPATLEGDWTAETARIHGVDPAVAPVVAAGLSRFEGEHRARLGAALKEAIDRGTPYDLELPFTAATGERKWVRTICRPVVEGGKVVRVRGSLQDVTERHALEEKLRQSQKMDAFGQLAGGVAHDFNNMLQVINGYATLLAEDLPPDDLKAPLVDEIRKAGERSAALTRQLLAFARQQVAAPRVVDLGAAAADTAGMLRRLIGEDVRLVTDLPAGTWPALIDPGQLEQVLLNLAVNARDAMPNGGTLTVAARNETVTADATSQHPDAKSGPYAVLSVTDTGTGMPPEVLARVFEPFFTTKGVGQGTGLGLATVYGIVRQAGGHVRVRSHVGAGSSFDVYLPRTADVDPTAAHKSGLRVMPRGTETVLVVEDEAAVRTLVRTVLTGRGYTVLEAADGAAAERVAAEHAGPIHLALSDVVMPGMGGRRAAAGVLARHPEARVVFMSGYTDDAVMRQGVSAADVPFLQKPFTPAELAAKVRQILDTPR